MIFRRQHNPQGPRGHKANPHATAVSSATSLYPYASAFQRVPAGNKARSPSLRLQPEKKRMLRRTRMPTRNGLMGPDPGEGGPSAEKACYQGRAVSGSTKLPRIDLSRSGHSCRIKERLIRPLCVLRTLRQHIHRSLRTRCGSALGARQSGRECLSSSSRSRTRHCANFGL